jgi:transcription elongation GreA/GreB family factor
MHPDLESLVTAGKLPAPAAEKLSLLEPGTFCLHPSWGPGRIAAWELGDDRVSVDFEGKAGHDLKLEFAAKSLTPLPTSHVLARRVADRTALAEMAEKQSADFVKLVLQSYGGRMMLDQFEDVVKPRILSEARFKPWWESTKKVLRTNKSFVVPPKRTVPLELRDEGLTHAEALEGDFTSAKDLKTKVKAAEAVLTNLGAFDKDVELLKSVLKGLDESGSKALRLQPAVAFELLLIRDELIARVPALGTLPEGFQTITAALNDERKAVTEVLKALPIGRTKQLLAAFPAAFGDSWLQEAFARLNDTTGRTVTEVARFVADQGKSEELMIYLQTGIQNRSLSMDALQWVCRERKADAFEVFDSDFAPAMLSALEREHYDESNRRTGRLRDLVTDDKELLGDLVRQLDPSQVKTFARRLWSSPVFDDLTRRSLLARVIKAAPEVQSIVEQTEDESDGSDEILIVSTQSYLDRQVAYERLIKEEIPQNTRDIAVARGYGDLRENFEFKSAKEQQRVLMRRQKVMEREISIARQTDFKDAPTHVVSIGTVVEFTDPTTGSAESMTILGAWDTEPSKGILSYLSGMSKALIGKAVGETAMLPASDGGTRAVTITSIRRFAQ